MVTKNLYLKQVIHFPKFIDTVVKPTRVDLLKAIPSLQAARKINNNIFADMQQIFEESITIAASIGQISNQRTREIADQIGLKPEDNIDLEKIATTSYFFDQKIESVQHLSEDIEIAFKQANK